MRAAFDESRFSDFLSDLFNGKTSLEDLKTKMAFKKVDAWNGQDAPPLEVSLNDFTKYIITLIHCRSQHTQTNSDGPRG